LHRICFIYYRYLISRPILGWYEWHFEVTVLDDDNVVSGQEYQCAIFFVRPALRRNRAAFLKPS